jgi:hypothetical protein
VAAMKACLNNAGFIITFITASLTISARKKPI